MDANEVTRLVNDGVAQALNARDTAGRAAAQRNEFTGTKMKDVPAVYHAKLGPDPAKWPAEEQAIREPVNF